MFKHITLKNFRQHSDAEFSFVGGLNVIRGASEAGKSTVFEALAYAMFGANALRESLEKTATWGQKESTLKVDMTCELNGDTYRAVRGKSGAEVLVNGKLQITGQKEVTRFFEALLGASAATTSNLMMADQTALRGALSAGPTATVALIETLANFDLITEIIQLVQEKLPTGNTASVESRIATLAEQVVEPLVDNRTETQVALDAQQLVVNAADMAADILRRDVDSLSPDYLKAMTLDEKYKLAQTQYATAQQALSQAVVRQAAVTVPDAPDLSKIPALEAEIRKAADHIVLITHKQALEALPDGDEWDEGAETLQAAVDVGLAEISTQQGELTTQQGLLAEHKQELTRLTAKLITATHCAFCDKDLTDVPEVVTFNAELSPKITATKASISTCQSEIVALQASVADARAHMATLTGIQNRSASRSRVYQAAAAYITLDDKFVPARWTWTGPDMNVPVNKDAKTELAAIRAAVTAREQALGRQQEAAERVATLQTEGDVAFAALNAAKAASEVSESVRSTYVAKVVEFNTALAQATAAKDELKRLTDELRHAQSLYDERTKSRTALEAQLKQAQDELVETGVNNALLKKLRGAKPVVADKLWGIVLASVSKYFSAIRGVASVVTRGGDGFLVDGQSIGGLSGSTLDSLGLAIRIALTKTFLPNARFMVLDEPASACDSNRETNMLGVVAGADFDQVLLVTHSDLGDSYAAQVIQL